MDTELTNTTVTLLQKMRDSLMETHSLPIDVEPITVIKNACNVIEDLLAEVKTLRESLDDKVADLFKVALSIGTTYDKEGLVFELGVYAESLFSRLIENDWYNGDIQGEDSKSYFECERDLIKVITLTQNLSSGKPIEINTLRHFPIVQMHEWTHLTKEVVLACREEQEWLQLDLAPEYSEQ